MNDKPNPAAPDTPPPDDLAPRRPKKAELPEPDETPDPVRFIPPVAPSNAPQPAGYADNVRIAHAIFTHPVPPAPVEEV